MGKKTIGLLCVLCFCIARIAFYYINRNQEAYKETNAMVDSTQESSDIMKEQDVVLTFGTTKVQATLNTSETAQEFIKKLPLEIDMTRYDEREYYAAINQIVTADEVVEDYENGDITYYTSGQSLAIFFNKANTSSQTGLIKIGSITSDLSIFDAISDTVPVTIRLADNQQNSSEVQNIQMAYQERCDAMINKDIQKLDTLLADDLVLHHISGTTQSKEEWLACIADESMKYHNITIESIQAQMEDDIASVAYTTTIDAQIYGSEGTWTLSGTSYYENRDGEWIFVNPPA